MIRIIQEKILNCVSSINNILFTRNYKCYLFINCNNILSSVYIYIYIYITH